MLLVSTLQIVKESENKMLSRRELVLIFKGGSGLVSRQSAADAIASKLGVTKEKIKLISLSGKFGTRDVKASIYVYDDLDVIKSQLPKYLALRELSKEERKKAKEAAKPKAVPAEQAKKA